jgi:hypothetical protein
MAGELEFTRAAKDAFSETVQLKMRQFAKVVPKCSNPALTGEFMEEVVREFVQEWIAPCQLCHGTCCPHNLANPADRQPNQIDGIVYDPRLGPTVIREGNFLVAHPAFCRGIIEIKASEKDFKKFEEGLQHRYRKYLQPAWEWKRAVEMSNVMGVVLHDALYDFWAADHCPIFILFKENDGEYEPYENGIDAMIKAIHQSRWYVPLESKVFGGPMPLESMKP